MNIFCEWFGHRPEFGYSGEGSGYFEVNGSVTDGIGRVHLYLWCTCERCGERFHVGNIYLPKEFTTKP